MVQWQIEQSLFSQKRIKIYLLGDSHVGHEFCDTHALQEICKRIAKERNSCVILMGDMIELGIKPRMRTEQIYQTSRQLNHFLDLIAPIKKKVIAVLQGNHEQRIENVDYLQDALMPHLPNAHYLGYEGFINANVRGHDTIIYLHHGSGGSQNPEYFIKKLIFNVGIGAVADVVAVGHIHKQYHKPYILPMRTGMQVKHHVCHGIRTGCFLSGANYAKIAGFGLSKVGGMVLEIDTRNDEIKRRIYET